MDGKREQTDVDGGARDASALPVASTDTTTRDAHAPIGNDGLSPLQEEANGEEERVDADGADAPGDVVPPRPGVDDSGDRSPCVLPTCKTRHDEADAVGEAAVSEHAAVAAGVRPITLRLAGHRPVDSNEETRTEPMAAALSGGTGIEKAQGTASLPPQHDEAQDEDGEEARGGASSSRTAQPAAREVEPRTQGTAQHEEAPPKKTPAAAAWTLDFSASSKKTKRKTTRKERDAMNDCHWRRVAADGATDAASSAAHAAASLAPAGDGAAGAPVHADSEGNTTALPVVSLDGLADRAALIPTNLTSSTRDRLQERLCLRMPRLLCVNKQYPRSCGISSLASVYNYLYSWLGETPEHAANPPISQEELMSILGFAPPFGEIPWGGFTGNATLIRWFYALNRHFNRPRGRAYILYKAHGHGKTTHLFDNDNGAILAEVKKCLANPRCSLIYHCYNHYMCPIGYQEIPIAQTDFLKPDVPVGDCDTTIFIGEVSRGRHEALYARKWSEIVRDIECQSPSFFNIRHPELGIQSRAKGANAAGAAAGGKKKGVRRKSTAAATAPMPPSPEGGPAAAAHAPAVPSGDAVAEEPGERTAAAAIAATGPDEGGTAAERALATSPPAPCEAATAVAEEAVAHTPPPGDSPVPLPCPPPQAVEASDPTAAATAAARPTVKKERGGNLHCLICFRTDEEEVNPALYESISEDSESEVEEEQRAWDRRGRADSSDDEGNA